MSDRGHPQSDPPVRLREYASGDLQAIFALDEICFEQPFRFSLPLMRRFAEARNALTVIAHLENPSGPSKIVGFCIAHVEHAGGHRVAYVVTLDVAPEQRRHGLAQRMLRQIEEEAQDSGCIAMALHVSTENDAAIRFYERMGYERSRAARSFYGLGRHAWVYRKPLGRTRLSSDNLISFRKA